MPFEIHPVYRVDIPKFVEIEFRAYASSPDSQILRGREAGNVSHHYRALWRYGEFHKKGDPHKFYMIVDTDAVDTKAEIPKAILDEYPFVANDKCPWGKVIGWYRYEIFPQGATLNEPTHLGFTAYEWPIEPKEHRAVVKEYWETMERDRRLSFRWQSPHIHLCLIVIDPSYQRRGAGKQCLEHLCKEADSLQLPVVCQASADGRALYEKFGFVFKRLSHFATHCIGIPGTRLLWNMVRAPKPLVPNAATSGTHDAEDNKGPMVVVQPVDPEPAEGEKADNDREVETPTKVADSEPAKEEADNDREVEISAKVADPELAVG